MKGVEITTERLLLRTVRPGDAAAYYGYRSLPKVRRYQGCPKSLSEARRLMAACSALKPNTPRTWYQFAVIEKSGGAFMGDIAVHFTDGRQAELGYTLAPKFQGRGYATEAAAAVLGWLFGALKLHRVAASADPRNKASIVVMKRLGMRKEGYFKKSFWTGKEWSDDVIYAVLKEDWKDKR
jgi:RimJ/RimL family protein N-acetyltransferase